MLEIYGDRREVKGSRRETRISANTFLQAREPSQPESPQGRVLQQKDVFVLQQKDMRKKMKVKINLKTCTRKAVSMHLMRPRHLFRQRGNNKIR